jgi:peptide/nickel transport system permease protein
MSLFLFKRFITLLVTLAGASVVIFLVLEILPGDAAQILMGPDASPEAVTALAQKLGIDQPGPRKILDLGDWPAAAATWASAMPTARRCGAGAGAADRHRAAGAHGHVNHHGAGAPAGIYAAARHNKLGDVG